MNHLAPGTRFDDDVAMRGVMVVCVVAAACGDGNKADPVQPDAFVEPDAWVCEPAFPSRKIELATASGGFGIAAGDLDEDGDLDVVSAHGGPVTIIRNRGDLTFDVTELSGASGRAITLGRFDADAHLDLAVTDGNAVAIRLGNGDATFGTAMTYATGDSPWDLVAADFSGDGILDLATPNLTGGSMSVLIGNGDGTFATSVPYQTDTTPTTIAVGDLDGDTVLDIAVATQGTIGNLSLFRGNGDGTFTKQPDLAAGNGGNTAPYGIAIADVDADGKADLLFTDGNLGVGLKRGKGDFMFHDTVGFSTGNAAMGIEVADMNLDGKLDVLAGSSPGAAYLAGNGDGTFATASITMTGPDLRNFAVGDFDKQGALDVATVGNFVPSVHLLIGDCSNR